MRDLIPATILQRIKEFTALGKTGQVVLNIYDGGVVSADVREHIRAEPKKILDKRMTSQ